MDVVFNMSYEEIYSLKGLVTKSAVSEGGTINKYVDLECGVTCLNRCCCCCFYCRCNC